jgi:hypothetical protein
MSFQPAPTRKHDAGRTADRQRVFIEQLAATGSVTQAAAHVGLSVQSAYRLRGRPEAADFDRAWRMAQRRAGSYLMGIALDRAINGSRRELWRDGKLVATQIVPSDRLLMFAIDRLTMGFLTPTPSPDDILDLTDGFEDHAPDTDDEAPLPITLSAANPEETVPRP